MRYAGWSANHKNSKYEKHWKHNPSDIEVRIERIGYVSGDILWEVVATGEDLDPLINHTSDISREKSEVKKKLQRTLKTKKKAETLANGLRDAIHGTWSILNKEPMSEGKYGAERQVRNETLIQLPESFDEESIAKGYATGVVVVGPSLNPRGMDWYRYAIDYYMTDHVIEPQVTSRYSVVDYSNDINEKENLEEVRRKSGLMKSDESELNFEN